MFEDYVIERKTSIKLLYVKYFTRCKSLFQNILAQKLEKFIKLRDFLFIIQFQNAF